MGPPEHTEILVDEKNIGSVELESPTPNAGKVLCLFEPWALERLATVREGATIRLICQFYRIEGEAPNRIPVFHDCQVDD